MQNKTSHDRNFVHFMTTSNFISNPALCMHLLLHTFLYIRFSLRKKKPDRKKGKKKTMIKKYLQYTSP